MINLVSLFAVKAGTGASSRHGWFALVVRLGFAVWVVAVSLVGLAIDPRSSRSRAAIASAAGTARRQVWERR